MFVGCADKERRPSADVCTEGAQCELGYCIEGLCSNVAIKERLGLEDVQGLIDLQDDNPVWDLIAGYLGDFCANLFLTVSVERIIIGGGICERAILMDKIRARFLASIGGYV